MRVLGDRLRGSEEELAGAVGAVGVEEGDSDWIKMWWEQRRRLNRNGLHS